jgi:hypothetical protein
MEYDERADELEKEADRLEHDSKRLREDTDQARTEWDAAKSDPSKAPGAQSEDAAGPHNIDAEDPATGRKYGEERQAELEDARAADSEDD